MTGSLGIDLIGVMYYGLSSILKDINKNEIWFVFPYITFYILIQHKFKQPPHKWCGFLFH
jgi:hypothetical protein